MSSLGSAWHLPSSCRCGGLVSTGRVGAGGESGAGRLASGSWQRGPVVRWSEKEELPGNLCTGA